jgi:ankyrin repeat protein
MKPRSQKKNANASSSGTPGATDATSATSSSASNAIKQPVQDKAIAFIISGNIEGLSKMLEEGSTEIKFLNRIHSKTGKSSLMVAAEEGRREAVECLLAAKPNINMIDKSGSTAFLYAVRAGEMAIVEMLENSGADIYIKTEPLQQTALLVAARYNHINIVKFLLRLEFPVDTKDANEETALSCALTFEHFDVATLLLASGADINVLGKNENTPLIRTSFDKRESTAAFIIANGGRLDARNFNGETALIVASKYRNMSNVIALIGRGCSVNEKDNAGKTALIYAAIMSDLSLVKVLVENNADVDIDDLFGYSALHHACRNADGMAVVEFLLSQGANINQMDRCFQTPLMIAVIANNIDIVFALLKAGADFSWKNIDDKNLLDLMTDSSMKSRFIAEYVDSLKHDSNLSDRYSAGGSKSRANQPGTRQKPLWLTRLNAGEYSGPPSSV